MNTEIVLAQQAKEEMKKKIEQMINEYNDKYEPIRIWSLEVLTIERSIREMTKMLSYETRIVASLPT